VEGADLVAAGLAAGRRPQVVFVQAERAPELGAALGLTGLAAGHAAVYPVTSRVAERISTLETPPDVMAMFALPERAAPSALTAAAGRPGSPGLLVVYADGIGDPGNMGTLLRAAAAFGAGAFVTAPGSADLFGPKTVRAGMGALFGLALFPEVGLAELLAAVPVARVYGLAAHGGTPLAEAGLERPAVLVVGAERLGISEQALPHIVCLVTIPVADGPGVESLNAGVAGAIALYELSRRPRGGAADQPDAEPAPQEG